MWKTYPRSGTSITWTVGVSIIESYEISIWLTLLRMLSVDNPLPVWGSFPSNITCRRSFLSVGLAFRSAITRKKLNLRQTRWWITLYSLSSTKPNSVWMSSSYLVAFPRMSLLTNPGRWALRPHSTKKSTIARMKGCSSGYTGFSTQSSDGSKRETSLVERVYTRKLVSYQNWEELDEQYLPVGHSTKGYSVERDSCKVSWSIDLVARTESVHNHC